MHLWLESPYKDQKGAQLSEDWKGDCNALKSYPKLTPGGCVGWMDFNNKGINQSTWILCLFLASQV